MARRLSQLNRYLFSIFDRSFVNKGKIFHHYFIWINFLFLVIFLDITDMVKEEYSSKRRDLNSFLVHLHRYSWLKMRNAIFHLILLLIHVQNLIPFWQDLMWAIILTIIEDKMKIFSYSTTQHAIEDVKFSFSTSISQFYFCH